MVDSPIGLSQVVCEFILIGMILVFSVAVFLFSLCRKPDCSYFISYFKGQLQRFHKLSLFDRFRHVENGLDINFSKFVFVFLL